MAAADLVEPTGLLLLAQIHDEPYAHRWFEKHLTDR